MKKIIFLDLDGTLRNDDRIISDKNKNSIRNMLNLNHEIIITSGRDLLYLKEITQQLNLNNYFIASDGSLIYDIKNNKIIKEDYIKEEDIRYLLNNIENSTYLARSGEIRYKYLDTSKALPKISFITIENEDKDTILRILNKINQNKNIYASNYSRELIDGKKVKNNYYISVISINSSKGNAAKYLYQLLNYKKEQTISIGDSINDISMLNETHLKVAMGNAVDELKKVSNEITLSNNNDGVSYILEKIRKEDLDENRNN